MHRVEPKDRPAPGGHYSPGIAHNGFVFVSGQLPIKAGQAEHMVGSIEEQTEIAMRNVEAILVAGGSSLEKAVQMTIYVSDIDLWTRVNAAYKRIMGENRPARAVVPVKELHYGYQIEIQAIGAI